MIRRREFISLLGGTAAGWPLAAWAQQGNRRRIGILLPTAPDDLLSASRLAAFRRRFRELGWIEDRDYEIDLRLFSGDPNRARAFAAELVGRTPDVLLGHGSPALKALSEMTNSLPIIFVSVVDPVGAGVVASLAKPGGNSTGFSFFDYGISTKWLEILREVAPGVTQVAVLRDTTVAGGPAQFGALQALAPSLRIELTPISVRDRSEIEQSISVFARKSHGGLIVLPSGPAAVHRSMILALAARHSLPAVYPYSYFVTEGGLISYGVDVIEHYRLAAGYVDRILRGEKPADLPVHTPTKYELVINLKTAKALGLEIPATLLARADEVIE
jgi:ABC-type uncharacterized transport system substrate-binding protein